MKSKLSKKKLCLIFFSCVLCITFIYFGFVQRWTGAVDVNLSDVERLSCFDNKDAESIIKNVFDKSNGDEISGVPFNGQKEYKCNEFSRKMTVEWDFKSMRIDYEFTDASYSYIHIYIAPKQTVFYSTLYQYDSIETVKNILSDEIGKNRFIYDRFAKQGTIANVNYYISPLTTNSRKTYLYMFPNKRLERTVYSVFEVGNYSISIHEIISFDNESKYNIALNDFTNLLQETQ